MRNKSVALLLAAILTLLMSGCNSPGEGSASSGSLELQWSEPTELQPIALGETEKLQVVATTTIVGDVVSFIGGSEIELNVLMPYNVDPHAYEPTPSDLRALSDANVIFINGLGLESSLHDYLVPIKDRVPVISLSAGVATQELEVAEGGQPLDEYDDGVDPHVWFDPNNVKHWAERIVATLASLSPSRKSVFEGHGEIYISFLDNLDEWIKESVDQVPAERRIIVSDHYSFGYFAERYGFEVAGAVIPVYSSAAEPSAKELARLEETINRLGVNVIFVGETINPGVAESLAEDSGVTLVHLYTGSLSEPEGPAASYLNFMQYNVTQIVDALLK
jgi:manganese/iron transport system substrate-binding protein